MTSRKTLPPANGRAILRLAVIALASSALCVSAWAQTEPFPSKPIKFISCCAGIIDATARVLADQMSKTLGQPIVVETKPGASGMIAGDFVAKSKPDGYTVFIGTNSTHAANQSLFVKVPYDYVKDFVPVSGIAQGVLLLIAGPNVPAGSVSDLTALARSKPGKLTYGWGSSSTRAGVELYKQLTGVNVVDVPYKTNPQATADVLGGQIDFMMADPVTSVPLAKSGKVKALAVSGQSRIAAMPEVPTMQDAGVAGYDMTWWVAAWVPAGTPPDIVAKLNAAFAQAIPTPKTAEFFQSAGLEPFATSSDDLMKFQMSEYEKWKKIVTAAGIQPQ